jgi:DNA invertase Pin-like site-specific DNA recombinase
MQKSLSKEDRKMTTYGYARVSTDGQSLASQDAELHAAGCAKVYAEKISGARSDRPELAKVLKRLDTGDVLIVTRLDRLARSTRDLLNILDDIAKRGAGFKSLHDSWADTTSAHGRLMVTILAGLIERASTSLDFRQIAYQRQIVNISIRAIGLLVSVSKTELRHVD